MDACSINQGEDMAKYKVTKIMVYTETVEVEAEDVPSAILKSYEIDGEHNNDDYLKDVRVLKVED